MCIYILILRSFLMLVTALGVNVCDTSRVDRRRFYKPAPNTEVNDSQTLVPINEPHSTESEYKTKNHKTKISHFIPFKHKDENPAEDFPCQQHNPVDRSLPPEATS